MTNFNSFEELFNKSPILNKIEKLLIEKISPKLFNDEISTYIKFFELLKNYNIYGLNEIISFFDKFWLLKKNLEMNNQFSFDKLNSQLISLFQLTLLTEFWCLNIKFSIILYAK